MPHIAEKLFSATYGGTRENFFVKVSSSAQAKISSDALKIFCVVQNILQRGSVTKPSVFLKSVLGEPPAEEKIFLIDATRITWNNIKGDDAAGNYPARTFYNELLEKYLGEYSFVRNLILPETDFADILTANRNFDGQQVDFYFPQMKSVFEIDGASHDTPEQKDKDELRDKALRDEGITVERINTAEIYNETQHFKNIMKSFLNELRRDDTINFYRAALKISADDLRVQYDAVMRLQMAILFCLREGIIDLSKQQLKIKIMNTDVKNLSELLTAAYEDLKLWIENVAQLAKVKIKLPALKISPPKDKNALALDFCMFRRYVDGDENFKAKNALYVRTDYFPDKDYFRLAAAEPIKYKFTAKDELKDDASFKFLLKNLFGHDDFRTGQLPIIKNILSREDTIGILPTGTGKSLCFQLSVLLQPGVSIVIAPLVSLIQDQKRAMEAKGITRVDFITSAVAGEAREKVIKEFKAGKYQFMVVSPERLQNSEFRDALGKINSTMKFSTAVIDEVHCLSEWGHDFRVSYLRLIPTIKKYCADACLLGLTATASQAVLEDLKAEFDNDGRGIKALQSMDRNELTFTRLTVKTNRERNEEILKIIRENDGTYTGGGVEKNRVGLIFCQTIKPTRHEDSPAVTRIYKDLLLQKFLNGRVEIFYSTLKDEEKSERQAHFMEKNFSGLMVCTTAFGMGIDKENIKYTIHASLPKSIESFYQEAGRAGRDEDKSTKSHCYLLHKPEEISSEKIEKIFAKNTGVSERKELCKKLDSDLSTVLYFLNLERYPPEEECDKILKILAELEAAPAEGDRKFFDFDDETVSFDKGKKIFELLKKNGYIQDWSFEQISPNAAIIRAEGLDFRRLNLLTFAGKKEQDILERLRGGKTKFHLYENFSLNTRQHALYKLTLLGIVRDWTINYSSLSSGRLYVDYAGVDLERVKNSLLKYIHKHDVEFSLDGKNTRYEKYFRLAQEK
ncbi:MAG: RecQ family ATP-dependent DNA helicase, partial [Selenomonadaceae bacterium]|nr:RecQ family ATP-dependent DNA helicase [Selenomonadaceae bacterium]